MAKSFRAKSVRAKSAKSNKAAQPDTAHLGAEAIPAISTNDHSVQGYGAAKIIQMDGDDKAKLGMNYAPFKAEIIDVDVVLIFEDGSRIIIPGMAMAAKMDEQAIRVFCVMGDGETQEGQDIEGQEVSRRRALAALSQSPQCAGWQGCWRCAAGWRLAPVPRNRRPTLKPG